ncbi:two-partner secretion domain-containing protein [Massilia yuzhufengensis]|uniref:Filamentous hemagglutinin family N-terminal domain-containing protein n=1 Tax=Massilia yuzhufengensis TaxID=1164594 RepID=A0A1I1NEN4_9BURK|nr:filamentous hemagglutinin N-terminal domain-containing protein [Massilia yuzhufengensis]SFC96141.1 filamentous hemagglutinin family N-terminal domain-containing protein [Massilia yuzhufengensis]
MSKTRNGLIRLSRAALCVAACVGAAHAAPTLPKVVTGQATFTQDGNVFSITNTPGTIINWQSFSVNAGEITRFIQQSSDSAVLNRIVGQDPSRILGALQSNGKVFLINPNGVVFGRGARVDVNGLVASTLNLSDADFLAGKKNFSAGPAAGAVRNEGAITTPSGGKVFLVAPNVENSGVITAPNGEVVLAAGRSVQLVDAGNPDMTVVVSAPDHQAINLGQVVAQGGRIGIYGALVNQRGVVNANSAVLGQDGKITLKASRDTVLEAGTITSATGAGKGGTIELLGQRVGLAGNAAVDASGALGGGAVLVGGDYQGKNAALPNAQQTWFGKDASIRADAIQGGDGGKVVLWSDGATAAYGSISVRGSGAGQGGLVETSGHDLDIDGIRVDAGAAAGRSGTWLLDPWNIIVANGGTAAASDVNVFSKPPMAGDTRIAPATLLATNANIVLQAENDLRFENDLETLHSVRAEAKNNLTVNALVKAGGDIDLRATNRLTLGANGRLVSPNYIDLKADRMTLAGDIDGAGGVFPVVSFNPFLDSTAISVRGLEPAGMLALDPARLAAFRAYEINLGSSAHNAAISIDDALSLQGSLLLDTRGAINVNAPVRLQGAGSQFMATLHPDATPGTIQVSGAIEAVKKIQLDANRVVVGGALGATDIDVSAGNGGIALSHNIGAGNQVSLRSSGAVNQDASAAVTTSKLLVEGSEVGMAGANRVSTLAGSASERDFRFRWIDDLHVGAVGGVAGLKAKSQLSLTGGALFADSSIESDAALLVDAAFIGGTGSYKGTNLDLASLGGIGSATSALRTSSTYLSARNTGSGSAPLNIVNDRALTIGNVVQAGSGNGGAISIESTGSLTVAPTETGGDGVKTGSGNISLVTHSPLTILGKVSSNSGNIVLRAENNGALTIASGGQVATASGNVSLTAGSISYPAGSIVVSGPDKLSVTNTSAPVDPRPDPVPPLNTCLSNPGASGCSGVLEAATRTCIANPGAAGCTAVLDTATRTCTANPAGPQCAQVLERNAILQCVANPKAPGCSTTLPSYEACAAAPSKLGCAPVIAEREAINACIANPKGAGCAATLPPLAVCTTAPSTYGCAPVIAEREALDACIANPTAPGCGAVLPPLAECRVNAGVPGCAPVLARAEFDACLVNPSAPGCAARLPALSICKASPGVEGCAQVLQLSFNACLVNPRDASCAGILPTLSQCVMDKAAAGCQVVLPTLAQCIASPALAGCSVQLPSLPQCVADKGAPGCQAVLPTLAQCVVNPALAGCSVQLPTLSQCIANPALSGCSVQLPSLSQCVADKGAAGCQAVLPTLAQCIVNPATPGCSAQLPTLSQCVADKGAAGCQAVLPTLAQCIGSPTLQGCSVQLPTLSQCAANPQLAGCAAVLPKPDFCATHPLDQSCVVFNPAPVQDGGQSNAPVAQAQQATVKLINAAAPAPAATGASTAATSSGGTSSTSNSSSEGGAAAPDKAESKAGPATSTNTGVKNEKPAAKMYCN